MKKPEAPEIGEMISLLISVLLLVGIAGYLVYAMTRPQTDIRNVRAGVSGPVVESGDGTFILPLQVENLSPHTIPKLKFQVIIGHGNDRQVRDFEVEYIGGKARRDFYMYLDAPARESDVQVIPGHYQLD